jgi:hypothetical protein
LPQSCHWSWQKIIPGYDGCSSGLAFSPSHEFTSEYIIPGMYWVEQ